jgi:hypothetical protein
MEGACEKCVRRLRPISLARRAALAMSHQAPGDGGTYGFGLTLILNCLLKRSLTPGFVKGRFPQSRFVPLFQQLIFTASCRLVFWIAEYRVEGFIHDVPVLRVIWRTRRAALTGNGGSGLGDVSAPVRPFSVTSSPIVASITDGRTGF